MRNLNAGWSSLAARRAHNPKVVGSNPTPATNGFSCRRIWWFALVLAHIGLGCSGLFTKWAKVVGFIPAIATKVFERPLLGPFLQAQESVFR